MVGCGFLIMVLEGCWLRVEVRGVGLGGGVWGW